MPYRAACDDLVIFDTIGGRREEINRLSDRGGQVRRARVHGGVTI